MCRDKYGTWYIQRSNLSVAWVHAYQHLNASYYSSHTAKLVKSIKINPGRIFNLPVVTRTLGTNESMEMIVEMMENIPGLQYIPMLVSLKNDTTLEKFTIPGKNVSKGPISIKAGKELFTLEPVIDVQCQTNTISEVSPETKKVVEETGLSQAHKKQFEELLPRYLTLFATKDSQWGSIYLITHKILLSDETPIKDKVHQIPHGLYEEVKKTIKEMLKSAVIRPSHSSQNSNIGFPKKTQHGTYVQTCNHSTIKVSKTVIDYHTWEDILDQLAGAKCFSCLNLKNDY